MGVVRWFLIFAGLALCLPAEGWGAWHDAELQNCLGPVHQFANIELQLVGSAKGLGLKEEEILAYAQEVFAERFGKMRVSGLDFEALRKDKEEAAKTGLIQFTVWTLREEYPVLFHIEARVGSVGCLFEGREFRRTTYLGYVPVVEVPGTIRDAIREVLEKESKQFFEMRYAP